jgi:hypothetical protein
LTRGTTDQHALHADTQHRGARIFVKNEKLSSLILPLLRIVVFFVSLFEAVGASACGTHLATCYSISLKGEKL